ncbi:MAG: peptide chain release factor N(5)-glutamine methyltransferase [Bifidobacteriaceae bacterium]|jgi:release factor glutamine methyltransferase|nr:peptide chain release factor N(5)-glutamine methyltransferase [Bifidobacteriaceae bacterium]
MRFPSPDHERLAAALLGVSPGELRARALAGSLELPDSYAKAARRLERGEPLQYVVGRAPFRHLELTIGPGAFIPRPETEVVAGVAVEALAAWPAPDRLAVDLGTGAGPIAAALATEVPDARVVAVERAWAAAGQAKDNLEPLGVEVVMADAVHVATPKGPLADLAGRAAVVAANPPYLLPDAELGPGVAEYEPPAALFGGGPDGLDTPLVFLAAAARLLRPGGTLVMEHDPSQAAALRQAATADGLFKDAQTGLDLTNRDRYIRATRA